ncbi:Uncharacterized conserved protein, DUF58 family, contains vWF domain [Pseudarcicella hirudinis]|uniref:Uncharacterized conserved protein, DUF58 family, contains vWF domain n=2 Tax=Pseudarcicella hirudinis TaxID=1079859 RepID=A0A1I5WQX6_9BACT|nr:Uncharacterized conserved protein, DUF58 family, contains vWF domain [Pseudarcicella hirudinis]
MAFVVPVLMGVAQLLFFIFIFLLLIDGLILFIPTKNIFARRDTPDRLSNGDENPISIYLENHYRFDIILQIIDEIPFQFQKRDLLFETGLNSFESQIIQYQLRPTKRGEYNFGAVNVYVKSPVRLLKRRFQFSQDKMVAVYPSFLQMREYELMAISNRLTEIGVKKIRKIGNSQEFEQIRQYVQGDDIRKINWQATARNNELMVNAFQEEKSQAIYCLIDKGRVMKMPFEGLSLLDYAINASLVLSNIALYKQDKAGLMTFSDKVGQTVQAEKRPGQLTKILEILYKQRTRYQETDYEALYVNTKKLIRQRSLLVLFTNFETVSSMRRQLPYFRKLAKDHLLIIVFFENTELRALLNKPSVTTEEVYLKTIAEKYFYEKQQIVKELGQFGIQALLTPPQKLTVNTVNKYLEIKARGML